MTNIRIWAQRLVAGSEFVPMPVLLFRQAVAPARSLLSHPWRLKNIYIATRIAAFNRYRVHNNPSRAYDIALHSVPGTPSTLPNGPSDAPILNGQCASISKENVAYVFENVFGYGLAVEPTTYTGEMVEKSNGNATHDGQILQGPISAEQIRPGRVYQRLIDNIETGADGPVAVDLRTPLYGGRPPLVYVKRRSTSERFHNRNAQVEICAPEDVFSSGELDQLETLAQAMGLDYGEADVLRDVTDGRIYVVDVANTPAGPPRGLSLDERKVAVKRLATAFDDLAAEAIAGRRHVGLAPTLSDVLVAQRGGGDGHS